MAEVTRSRTWRGWLAAAAAFWLIVGVTSSVRAQDSSRPTIENRYGEKDDSVYGHATVMTHVRNDFYDSIGLGADLGFYPNERVGFEARWLYLFSSLSPAAAGVKEETGLTPDARPQHMMTTLGVRYSLGYGKMLIGESGLLHFDPQVVGHGGVAFAENRVLPTTKVGFSLLGHFQGEIQAKIDLMWAFQVEKRNRGWVPSIGFVPLFGIGWNPSISTLDEMGRDSEGSGEEGGR